VPLTHLSHLQVNISSCFRLTENDPDVHLQVSSIRDPSSLKIKCIPFALMSNHVRPETIVWVTLFIDWLTCKFIKLNLKFKRTQSLLGLLIDTATLKAIHFFRFLFLWIGTSCKLLIWTLQLLVPFLLWDIWTGMIYYSCYVIVTHFFCLFFCAFHMLLQNRDLQVFDAFDHHIFPI
jgi:hypothetical protein